MKKTLIFASLVLCMSIILISGCQKKVDIQQEVSGKTLIISKEYASLRYQTDNVLLDAYGYGDYDVWKKEMTTIIKKWNDLEKNANNLEKLAGEMADDKVSIKLIPLAYAYDSQEVNTIFQKAPYGQKIKTLAKHLGVDAKMAQLILNQAQDYSSREAYGKEGDEEEAYETAAITIKNTSKVTVFVGTIAISAPVGILAKTATIVAGADLTLEVTDDTAKIALGNKNKISTIARDIRKITEPAAAILSIATLPNNLSKGIEKLNAVIFGADQLNSVIQAGSVIGIKLPTYTTKEDNKSTVSVLTTDEIDKRIKDNIPNQETETKESIEKILGIVQKIVEKSEIIETKDENNTPPKNESKLMPVKEFEELFDDKIAFEKISRVKKIFGEPDEISTNENGYGSYIYYRRLIYPNGNIARFIIRFHNTDVEGYTIGMDEYK